MKDKLLQGYFNAMIFRDLIDRYKLSNPERVKYVIKRLMTGITKPASINAIYNDMRSQGRKVTKDDLYTIAEKACSIFLLYKVTKFDPSFKKETSALPKYYCVDNDCDSRCCSRGVTMTVSCSRMPYSCTCCAISLTGRRYATTWATRNVISLFRRELASGN